NDTIVSVTMKHAALLGPIGTLPAQHSCLPDEKEEECVDNPTGEIPTIAGPDDSSDDDDAKREE
ncbi:MAG: hypothetical protein ACWGQW_26605, partial [bacterium]